MTKHRKYGLLILFSVIILSIWPLSFFQFIPKWDNLDQYLPYRYLISTFWLNGDIPYWNPFQHLGETPYSDLQSGTWYPIVALLLFFGKYTITTLHLEIVTTFIIAGVGFFKLSIFFHKNWKIATILGLSYGLSGFMTGSAQLLTFLIGIAWLPWLVYAFAHLHNNITLKYILLASIFYACIATGAAPQFTIIASYGVLGFFFYLFFQNKETKRKTILFFLLMGISSLFLLAPFIKSFVDFLPYMPRTGKMPYNSFYLSNSFTVKEYISFLFPTTTISETDFFNSSTDFTLRNGYFGLVGFIGFILAWFEFKKYKWWIALSGFFLVLAMGGETFIYKLTYYLPGFGTFRHASFYKIYFILIALILAGFQLKKLKPFSITIKTKWILIVSLLILALIALVLFDAKEVFLSIFSYSDRIFGSFSEHLAINFSIILFLTAIFIALNKKSALNILLIITVIDLFFFTQFTAPKTITNNINFSQTQEFFNDLPTDIYQPTTEKIKTFDGKSHLKSSKGFWRNLSTLNQTISYDGYNPTQFKKLTEAEENGLLAKAIENPIIYGSDSILLTNRIVDYNSFQVEVRNPTRSKQEVILNQNYHHLWNANFDGEPLKIESKDNFTIKVKVPENSKGKLTFHYKSPYLWLLTTLSLITYIAIFIYLIRDRLIQNSSNTR